MATFTAKYHGVCASGDRITPGDEVTFSADDEIQHVECVGAEVTFQPIKASPGLCACGLELSLTGECGWCA